MSKVKILYLSATPLDQPYVKVERECLEIQGSIQREPAKDLLEFIPNWQVPATNFLDLLAQHKPHIVHFSGHGQTKTAGIFLLDAQRKSQFVGIELLKSAFQTLKENIRVVVLNACYTTNIAQEIAQIVGCAIGMNDQITDTPAIMFATSFYKMLALGYSVKKAFEISQLSLNLGGYENEANNLILHRGINIDPDMIYITKQPYRGYWLLSDANLWNSYITILDFAKHIHHTFQVLEHQYLHDLYSLVNNILSKPETLNMENSKHLETTWTNYVTRYSELKEQFLKNGFDDESQKVIDQSWSVVKTAKKEAIVSQLSEAEKYYKNIIESFCSYAKWHEGISFFVGTGENLFTDLQVPNKAMKFGVNFLNLERQGRSLTSNADNLIRILIQILLEE